MHWKLFNTNVVRGIISFRSWNCSQGISSWWHCLNLKLNFFIFLCFPILTELSQNCQGCFPGREKTMETKKKKRKEIRTEVVTWLLRPTRCFKSNFNSYFTRYLCAPFSYDSATLASLLFSEDTWPFTP